MNIKELNIKYPLTMEIIEELYGKKGVGSSYKEFFIFPSRLPPTDEDHLEALQLRCDDIKEPIWSLCEKVLFGDCEYTYDEGNKEGFRLKVGGVDFFITKLYTMFVETHIQPDVSENSTEYSLIVQVFNKEHYYQQNGRFREELMIELCGTKGE